MYTLYGVLNIDIKQTAVFCNEFFTSLSKLSSIVQFILLTYPCSRRFHSDTVAGIQPGMFEV